VYIINIHIPTYITWFKDIEEAFSFGIQRKNSRNGKNLFCRQG
jgi:hypothetical protein